MKYRLVIFVLMFALTVLMSVLRLTLAHHQLRHPLYQGKTDKNRRNVSGVHLA